MSARAGSIACIARKTWDYSGNDRGDRCRRYIECRNNLPRNRMRCGAPLNWWMVARSNVDHH